MKPPHPSWIIVLAGITAALHVGKLPPALPVLQQELGVTLVQAGFLISMMQFAGMTLGMLIGLSADAWGLRRSVLAGLLTLTLASVAGGLTTGVGLLLLLRALEGLGFLLAVMPAPALIRRNIEPRHLSARMGWWGAFMPTGTASAFLLGPLVLAHWGWPVWWWSVSAASALAAVAIFRWVPADAPAAGGNAYSLDDWQQRLMRTLQSRGPWLVALAFGLYAAQWMSVIGFLPVIYREAGVSAALTGVLTAGVAFVNIAGNVMAGRLLQAGWSAPRLLQTGFACMALGALGTFAQWDGVALPLEVRFLAVLLLSSVGGLIPGTLFSLSVRLAPGENTVSTTVGLMQQGSSTGQFLGPPLVAWVNGWAGGWHWTWLVTGLFCGIGWMLALYVRRIEVGSKAAAQK